MSKRHVVLCLGEQLHGRLQALAKLESRHLTEQVIYLLEVMLAIAHRQRKIALSPEPIERSVANLGIKLVLTEELDEELFHFGASYGLTKQQIIRTFLWMGLSCRERIGHQDLVLRKEDFVELSLERFQVPARIQ